MAASLRERWAMFVAANIVADDPGEPPSRLDLLDGVARASGAPAHRTFAQSVDMWTPMVLTDGHDEDDSTSNLR